VKTKLFKYYGGVCRAL